MVFNNSTIKIIGTTRRLTLTRTCNFSVQALVVANDPTDTGYVICQRSVRFRCHFSSCIQIGNNFSYIDANNGIW